jgi:hypothetical protein
MPTRIKPDVLKALEDWKAGKPVKSLELGQVHRMQERGQFSPVIDFSVRLSNDQERAHAYFFWLIEWFKDHGPVPVGEEAFERFISICDMLEGQFDQTPQFASEDERNVRAGLTAEERDAAESLAWKAIQVGWVRAITGHDASQYIEVSRPQVETST